MSSYDGVEICELVGLFILNHLGKSFGKENIGSYRDDGRAVARTLIGGGGIFIYLGYARLTSLEINFISKETSRAEPEYMNIHPPPPM